MEHNKKHTVVMIIVAAALLIGGLTGGYAFGKSSSENGAPASSSAVTVDALAARASASDNNDVDLIFAQTMSPHHQQALEMAQLASTRAESADVKELARKIEAAQQPEIDKMSIWIKAWGGSEGTAMDHSRHGGSTGMMSDEDMAALTAKTGAAFDQAFLTMMIEHHEGAIDMAKTQLAKGQNAEALALATAVQVTQQAEVKQMKVLLQ